MVKKEYKCEYCGVQMQKFDYEMNKGFCGKCREVLGWKDNLGDLKELDK